MKIGIDIRNIGKKRTGDEVVFFNLTKNLAEIDETNEYKLFTDISDQETLVKIKKDLGVADKKNFEIISLSTANKFTWNFWTLQKYLRKNLVDIYLTQYITPFFVPRKIKIATIIHDVSFVVYKQFIKKSDLLFLSLLIPLSLKRADRIIAVSKFTRLEISKYYGTDLGKIDWIHNAVSAEFIQKSTELTQNDLDNVRKKYNLPEKFILYLGTLQPRKNIPTLIEGYAKLKESKTQELSSWVKLVIAGGKGHNYDQKIDEAVRKYNLENEVIFSGFIDEEDKAAIMKLAEVFAFPSFYEGFGIPILEAMSVGTPTVVSNILPHKEITTEAMDHAVEGPTALYFDPNNPQELSEKLLEVLNDEKVRQHLIQKGFEQVKNFAWEKTARKVLEIFEKMYEGNRN